MKNEGDLFLSWELLPPYPVPPFLSMDKSSDDHLASDDVCYVFSLDQFRTDFCDSLPMKAS